MGIPNLFHGLCDCLCISRYRILQKLFGAAKQLHPFPVHVRALQNLSELNPHLFIGDAHRPLLLMPGQVPQMNQQSQHIIAAFEGFKVILEKVCVDLYLFPGNQPGNGLLQPLKVHIDICHQGFRRRSPLPVGAELPLSHGQHD